MLHDHFCRAGGGSGVVGIRGTVGTVLFLLDVVASLSCWQRGQGRFAVCVVGEHIRRFTTGFGSLLCACGGLGAVLGLVAATGLCYDLVVVPQYL